VKRKIAAGAAILLVMSLLIPGTAVTAALIPPTQLFPENGATNLPTDTWVSWYEYNYPYDNPAFHVQVSRNSNFSDLVLDLTITDGSTGAVLRGLPMNTTFYWRVNLSFGGQTSDWSPVWSFTTHNQQPPTAAPTLVSPANGSTGLPRGPVTLTWNAVEGADSYDLQVSFIGIDGNVGPTTSWTLRPEDFAPVYSSQFHWRVRARNSAGVGPWSEGWVFSTR
jgi:hypothetical protein